MVWSKAAIIGAMGLLAACSGEAGVEDDASDLAFNGKPLECADPTVFTAHGTSTHYVYCTGMARVWKTSDWKSFQDERSSVSFSAGSLAAPATWWAPSIVYDADHARYVMWVSVPSPNKTWKDTRSLAVFASSTPIGPWSLLDLGNDASAEGEMIIDPMIFRDHDGEHYIYYKRYGGPLTSRIMGAHLDATLTHIVGTRVEIMNGYGGKGWEDNVRENPAVWRNPKSGHYHMLFSGAHYFNDTYATGHAISTCGPLCTSTNGWHISTTGENGIAQVVKSNDDKNFANGGPGGAEWTDNGASIVFAAAYLSSDTTKTAHERGLRYLMREKLAWSNGVPYVDTPKHHPHGF